MGRFGALDGLVMLALQICAVALGLLLARGRLRLPSVLLLGLLSYFTAFVTHIAAFIIMRRMAPLLYADQIARRPYIALVWALATAITALLWSKERSGKWAPLLCAAFSACAYYAFVALRA